ncbi:hypothetical protein SCLCIDRAFT_25907 [Scleroderma citrinum Foug A]|uniref:Uncharacterized protein n=1 Tax=Scleroderma citrinum Foug A TaxID=1036808 RepID=A0A0C3DYX2_9AGAM|nr:hypothetical protein SCLCIDRAFT_25907 [Scleroderma citrinum Foug A]
MDLIRTPIVFIHYRPPKKNWLSLPSASKHTQQISGFLPNWKPDRCGSMQSKPPSTSNTNPSKHPTLTTTHTQPTLTYQPYGGLTDQVNSNVDNLNVQLDEDYEPPSPAGRVMLECNSARGNEHKHGDDKEDDGSEMAASRPPSKVVPRSLVHKVNIETNALVLCRGVAQQVPSTSAQRCQATFTSGGHPQGTQVQQGGPTHGNNSDGEDQQIPSNPKAVPPRSLACKANVETNAPVSRQGVTQHVPSTSAQRCQATSTSGGHPQGTQVQQGGPTRGNDGDGEDQQVPSNLPKLTCKVPSTSQPNSTHGLRPAAATNVAHQRGGEKEMPSNDDEDGCDQEESHQPGRQQRHKAQTFHNVDLPGLPGSMSQWHAIYLPHWFQYIATLDNIWNLAHLAHLDTAQTIWNCKMTDVPHTLVLNDKPIFYLLKQCTYEWHSGMGDRAVKAVKAFFD